MPFRAAMELANFTIAFVGRCFAFPGRAAIGAGATSTMPAPSTALIISTSLIRVCSLNEAARA